ncbi:hypothetical protein ACYSNX_02250 [Myroides sp. LJL115]
MHFKLSLLLIFFFCSLTYSQSTQKSIELDTLRSQMQGASPDFDFLTDTIHNHTIVTDQPKTQVGKLIKRMFVKSKSSSQGKAPNISFDRDLALGEGKIIRNIDIVTLDPFGFSELDTLQVPTTKAENLGNRLHLKTKKFTIRNFLLFEKGKPFDSLMIKESERLIRSQRYVKRVLIYPIPTSSPDSVDIMVRELDYWTIYPSGSISTSSMRIRLTDKNFAGLGHELSMQYRRRIDQDKQGYYFNYRINNIQRTFIRSELLYDSDVWGNYRKFALIDRPFYSPYTKWAGGFNYTQRFSRDSLIGVDEKYSFEARKYNQYDTWVGHSIPLYQRIKDNTVITNLRAAVRYYQRDYIDRPDHKYDTIGYFSNSKTYLATLGISSINYIQDHYIFTHDRIEDVAVGKIFSITGGFNNQFNKTRSYFGAKFAMGKYTNFGYLASNIEWGSYFLGKKSEQGALRLDVTYFTKLLLRGNWKFRHFINPSFIMGYNRYGHMEDQLRLEQVIAGIRASKIRAARRVSLSYQWQAYAPYSWKGFHISPYVNIEGAFVGYKNHAFLDGKLYSRLSIGFVASNEYLVFSSIAISLVYYPTMPDSQRAVFYANGRKYDMELPDFNYGKPQTVNYY